METTQAPLVDEPFYRNKRNAGYRREGTPEGKDRDPHLRMIGRAADQREPTGS